MMVAGGTESTMNPLAIAGFSRIKALLPTTTTIPNNLPDHLTLTDLDSSWGKALVFWFGRIRAHETTRCKIYCELRGYGLSGDAHHITAQVKMEAVHSGQ